MIIKVKVDKRIYEVEIDDLDTEPIIARIGDEEFEVWKEEDNSQKDRHEIIHPSPKINGFQSINRDKVVTSPIPGVISQLFVIPGQKVSTGDPLLVIEAMKMNNTIRANRPGMIELIKVEKGAFVKHHQVLLEYTD